MKNNFCVDYRTVSEICLRNQIDERKQLKEKIPGKTIVP